MNNYLKIIKATADTQHMLEELKESFSPSDLIKFEEFLAIKGHRLSGGERILHNYLSDMDDLEMVHRLGLSYRMLGKLWSEHMLNKLSGLLKAKGPNNLPSSIIYPGEQIVDVFADYCERLIYGDLAVYVPSQEKFGEKYDLDSEELCVPVNETPTVIIDFIISDSMDCSVFKPTLDVCVQVVLWKSSSTESDTFHREILDHTYFRDGVVLNPSPLSD